MTVPLYLRLCHTLVNLANCTYAQLNDESITVYFVSDATGPEVEFDSEEEAREAFQRFQQALLSKNLLVGEVD